ncbi:CvpA family protein [Paenibacillus eucommiae]|uniref:Membrane protein required for colicin V production n=1 Tax=Paenibacillus eucommiae TaxID=1355755 RepID=A0ABS4J111_9BACL|nr:CvpA family protein [Paenibacillus eucommiae]MBP1993522.1 putative membrane protein required for colicin V production [Paenibacillus eucommiae]
MNALDYIMLAVIGGSLILGFMRGFAAQIISIAGFFIAYVIAFRFFRQLAPILQSELSLPGYESYQKYESVIEGLSLDTYVFNALSFAIIFFAAKIILSVIGKMLNFLFKAPGLNLINRWSGALLGLAEALLILIIAVNVLMLVPSESTQKLLSGSILAPYLTFKDTFIALLRK